MEYIFSVCAGLAEKCVDSLQTTAAQTRAFGLAFVVSPFEVSAFKTNEQNAQIFGDTCAKN